MKIDDRYNIVIEGKKVVLRDAVKSDTDVYIKWMKSGEWRDYDAPWETKKMDVTDGKIAESFKKLYLEDKQEPRKRSIISKKDGLPLGWVNRYKDNDFERAWLIGIDICEDSFLGKGIGTEVLQLWLSYLFSNSNVHRIGLHTYSFNERMIKVAKKIGLKEEGKDREIIEWKGEWIDRLRFGMLRQEWKKQSY